MTCIRIWLNPDSAPDFQIRQDLAQRDSMICFQWHYALLILDVALIPQDVALIPQDVALIPQDVALIPQDVAVL
jgi:hypothetical protein